MSVRLNYYVMNYRMTNKHYASAGVLILLSILMLCSCGINSQNYKENEHWDAYIESFIAEHIDSPLLYESDSLRFSSDECRDEFYNSPYKILFLVDLDCSACILKFDYWAKFSEECKEKYGITPSIIAIVHTDHYIRNLDRRVTKVWKGAWIYDMCNHIENRNELDVSVLQSVLIDQNGLIKIIGSPMEAKSMRPIYEEYIKSFK